MDRRKFLKSASDFLIIALLGFVLYSKYPSIKHQFEAEGKNSPNFQIKVLNGSRFDSTQNREPRILVFWATWCGPCKMMAPVFQQVAGELASRVRFAKVDTEAWPQVSMRHHIKGIPSLILFRNGSEVARISGAMDARNLKAWLASQGVH